MLPAARETLMAAMDAGWADPRRLYAEGRTARALLDQAREVLADGLGVRPPEVSFLPGGPAAIRAGLEGLRYAGRRRGARIVATSVEHSAILTTGRYYAAQAEDPSLFAEVPVDRSDGWTSRPWSRRLPSPAQSWLRSSRPMGRSAPASPSSRHMSCAGHGAYHCSWTPWPPWA